MFSAFSFGKIIKTILPGAILAAALLLIAEGLWGLCRPTEGFLLGKISKDWITSFTAALIPLSLILGFFLNTFAWMTLNSRIRERSAEALKNTAYAALRVKLTEVLSADSGGYFAKLGKPLPAVSFPSPPTLEYFYLPAVNLTNLNYLWESYFCWYEFDINSAAALVLFVPAAGFLLWVKLQHSLILFIGLILLLLALSCALYKMLKLAAVKNMVSYEKNLMLLITGALTSAVKNVQPPA